MPTRIDCVGNEVIIMKILITGGAGFIGSNFIFYMINKYPDYEFVCIDKLTYAGRMETIRPVINRSNFVFYRADICDRERVYNIFMNEKPDVVVNFAAESHVDRSIDSPEIFIETNIKGVSVLMDACLKYGVRRFHQIGTDEVYGDLPLDRPDLLFNENSPICPSSPYSSSKAAADMLVLAYHRTYGLSVTISRCSNNYGPYQYPEKLIPLMVKNAMNNQKMPVYGRGLNVRDWIHVYDHCKAVDMIINNGRDGQIYNVGGHCEKRNIDIVRLICDELGKNESLISYVEDRKGHDLRYAIDTSKLEHELGWKTEISFDDGIRDTIKWYVNCYMHNE